MASQAMVTPLFPKLFFHDGRGPELRAVHWLNQGRSLVAIDYLNPDCSSRADLHHVRFDRVQVVMMTPEEVIDYRRLGDHSSVHPTAAMFDLGRSPWLQQFSPLHLAQCRHVQLMFYDEVFDVICEDVACFKRGYSQ